MCEVFVLKILCFRYPRNAVTDILLSFLCLFIIILILQNGEQSEVVADNNGNQLVNDYLTSYGWDINSDNICVSTILMPDCNQDSMKDFFELQQEQGFELKDYIGKEIRRYDAEILNYPDDKAEGIFASVFIYENKIIASEIHSVSINGFMHGVDRNELTKA